MKIEEAIQALFAKVEALQGEALAMESAFDIVATLLHARGVVPRADLAKLMRDAAANARAVRDADPTNGEQQRIGRAVVDRLDAIAALLEGDADIIPPKNVFTVIDGGRDDDHD